MLVQAAPARAADLDLGDVAIWADRLTYDDARGVVKADGHVVVERQGVHIEASGLTLDTHARKGELRGPLHVRGGPFEVDAAGATFDLAANQADLRKFSGRWPGKAQFAGEHLLLGPRVFHLEDGWITSCMAPDPDLRLVARNFRYFPEGERLNLAGEGVALRMWDKDVLPLPYFNTSIGPRKVTGPRLDMDVGGLFPAFGFDAYRGILTGTRFDFTLGENSRGSVPIAFSTGRGWSGGIDHVLDFGPGEVHNAVNVETPWATGRGGLQVLDGYAWTLRNGTRLELDADYRADLNGQPVHRLPEAVWTLPTMGLPGLLAIHNELRAGYLWEESSGQQATRLRWAATGDTPIWTLGPWHTWFSATPFVNHYVFQSFAGFTSAWNHSQDAPWGLSTSEALELNRVFGETPFIHDRQYDTERARLGLNENWSAAYTTGVAASWSRINQLGAFSIEDVTIVNTYRWNCFGVSLVLHPLILGANLQLSAGMF